MIDGSLATKDNLNALMREPKQWLPDYLPHDDSSWLAERWRQSPYATWVLPPLFDARDNEKGVTVRGKGERSFLRWSPGEAGFLHDSFLYFFAARALRWPASPSSTSLNNRIDDTWARDVASWWLRKPSLWNEAAEFLGGLLWHREEGETAYPRGLEPARRLFDLIAHLIAVPTVPDGLAAVVNRLIRGRPRRLDEPPEGSEEAVLASLEAASVRPELESWPAILPALFIHWIEDLKLDDQERAVNDRIATRWSETILQPLLNASRQLISYWDIAPPLPRPEVLDQVRLGDRVEFVELLPGGRVLAIDRRGEVCLRDPVSGVSLGAPPLPVDKVSDLASRAQLHILSRESALYVDAAGQLFRLSWPRNFKKGRIIREPMTDFPAPVALVPLEGGEVLIRDAMASGSVVNATTVGKSDASQEIHHDAEPSGWIARLWDGRVQSWTDDEVILWDPGGRVPTIKGRFRLWSVSAAELLPGGALIAGTRDGELVRWDAPAGLKPTSLSTQPWPLPGPSIRRIRAMPNGWVVFVVASEAERPGPDPRLEAGRPGRRVGSDRTGGVLNQPRFALPHGRRASRPGPVVTEAELICFDCQSGTPSHQTPLLPIVTVAIPAPDGSGLILGGEGGLVAWSPEPDPAESSQWWIERWDTLKERVPARIGIDSRGRIFVGTNEGQVFAVNGPPKVRDDRPWHVINREFRERHSQFKQIDELGVSDLKAARKQVITDLVQMPKMLAFTTSIGQLQLLRPSFDEGQHQVGWRHPDGDVVFARWLPGKDKESLIFGVLRPDAGGVEVYVLDLLAPVGKIEVATWSLEEHRFPRCKLPALSDGHIVLVDSGSEHLFFFNPIGDGQNLKFPNPHHPVDLSLFQSLDKDLVEQLKSRDKNEIDLIASLDEKRHVTIGLSGGVVLWESAEPDAEGCVFREQKFLYRHKAGTLIQWLLAVDGRIVTTAGSEALSWSPDRGVETIDTGGISNGSRAIFAMVNDRLLLIGRQAVAIVALRTRELLILDRSSSATTAWTGLSPDRLVLGDAEGSIRVVRMILEPVSHRPEARPVALAPFGADRLALLLETGKLATLDIASGAEAEGPELEGRATCLTLGEEAGSVLVGTAEGRVLAWRPDRSGLVPVFEHPQSRPISAFKSLEGGRVVALDDEGVAFGMDGGGVTSARQRNPSPGRTFAGDVQTVPIVALTLLHDGRTVAASSDGGLFLESLPGVPWSLVFTLDEFPSAIVARRESEVAILGASGRVSVVDLELGREVWVVWEARGAITALGALDDGRLVLGCRDGDLLISRSPGVALDRVLLSFTQIQSVVVGPFGRIACLNETGQVWVVDPRRLESKLLPITAKVAIRWSDSNHLALVGSNGAIFLVDVPDRLEGELSDPILIVASGPPIRDLRFCHNSRLIAARADSTLEVASYPWLIPPKLHYREGGWGSIAAWDDDTILVVSARETVTWLPGVDRPSHLDRTPDRRMVRIATGSGGVVVFADERNLIWRWIPTILPAALIHDEHRAKVTALAIVQGTIVASGDERGLVVIHDLATGETRVLVNLGPDRPIHRVVALAGSLLVHGGDELHSFPVDDRRTMTFQAGPIFPEPIRGVAASEDWPVAVVATLENQLVAWDLAGGAPQPWGDVDPETMASLVLLVPMPDRRVMVVSTGPPLIILGDDGRVLERHELHCGTIRSAVALPGGTVVFERDQDALALLPGSSRFRTRRTIEKMIEKPDGTLYALRVDGVVVELLDSGEEGREVFRHRGSVAAQEPAEGDGLFVLIDSGDLSFWDAEGSAAPDFARSVLTAPPSSLGALPGGMMAVGCRDGTVRLLAPPYLPSVARPESRFHDHDKAVTQVMAISNGRVVSLDVGGKIVIRSSGSEPPVELPSRHRGAVDLLWASPEGNLISCGEDGVLATYDQALKLVALLPTYGKMKEIFRMAHQRSGSMTLRPERGPLYYVEPASQPLAGDAISPTSTPERPSDAKNEGSPA